MKPYILFDYIFNDIEFADEIVKLIKDKIDFVFRLSDIYEISFEDDDVDIIFNIFDAEDNNGSCVCTFNYDKLAYVTVNFMYEDGGEYDKVVYKG